MTDIQGTYPRFKHDCDGCTFLGQHDEVDLYFCGGLMPSVIARRSDEPADYSSGMGFSFGRIPNLTEARRRAQAQGLMEFNLRSALFNTPADATADVLAELKTALQHSTLGSAFAALAAGSQDGKDQLRAVVRSQLIEYQERYSDKTDDELLGWIASSVADAMNWARRFALPCPVDSDVWAIVRPA